MRKKDMYIFRNLKFIFQSFLFPRDCDDKWYDCFDDKVKSKIASYKKQIVV